MNLLATLDSMEASTLDRDALLEQLEKQFIQVALLIEISETEDEFEECDALKLAQTYNWFYCRINASPTITGERCESLYMKTWQSAYAKRLGQSSEDCIMEMDWRKFELPPHIVVRIATASAERAAQNAKAYFEYVAQQEK